MDSYDLRAMNILIDHGWHGMSDGHAKAVLADRHVVLGKVKDWEGIFAAARAVLKIPHTIPRDFERVARSA